MFRIFAEEAAALASLALFLGNGRDLGAGHRHPVRLAPGPDQPHGGART